MGADDRQPAEQASCCKNGFLFFKYNRLLQLNDFIAYNDCPPILIIG